MDNKQKVVTFKVDKALWEAVKRIPNRSEFIRASILAALESSCPLCSGTGIMSPAQKAHWETFLGTHAIRECEECHENMLVCGR